MYQVQHKPETLPEPRGELASRMLAMPSHTNPMGNIFGGWIMSVMDAAALMTATKIANGTVVTVFVSNMTFLEPGPGRRCDLLLHRHDRHRRDLDHVGG